MWCVYSMCIYRACRRPKQNCWQWKQQQQSQRHIVFIGLDAWSGRTEHVSKCKYVLERVSLTYIQQSLDSFIYRKRAIHFLVFPWIAYVYFVWLFTTLVAKETIFSLFFFFISFRMNRANDFFFSLFFLFYLLQLVRLEIVHDAFEVHSFFFCQKRACFFVDPESIIK